MIKSIFITVFLAALVGCEATEHNKAWLHERDQCVNQAKNDFELNKCRVKYHIDI